MRHRRAVLLSALAALAAVLAVQVLGSGFAPAPDRTRPDAAGRPAARDDGPAMIPPPAPHDARLEAPPPDSPPGVLRVWLRGLHAAAPWTTPLRVEIDGTDAGQARLGAELLAPIATDGTASVVLPEWFPAATQRRLRVEARDPSYRPLYHRADDLRDGGQVIAVDVQVIAAFTGRVVASGTEGVPAARVAAFAVRDGQPIDGEVGTTNCRADGTFLLQAPPGVPLFLLAVPMHPAAGTRRAIGYDGAILDHGRMRADLLPAATTATGFVGAPLALPDIELPAAAQITGRVRWQDGEGLADVVVQAMPLGGTRLSLAGSTFVQWHPTGTLLPAATATSDDAGGFALPGVPGAALIVQIRSLGSALDHGVLPAPLDQSVVAPQAVEFVLPRPVRLRVEGGGPAAKPAVVEIDGGGRHGVDRSGELLVVPTLPVRVRAVREQHRSPWRSIGPGDAGATIALPLATDLTEVAFDFDGDFPVRNTTVQWQRDDGATGSEHLLRDDRNGPFRIFLEPGRYRLQAGPGGGERNGAFLLPVERDLEVGAERVEVRLPAAFGGSFTVMATNRAGLWVGGRCQLLAASGEPVPVRFRVQERGDQTIGGDGELLPEGTNACTSVLPAGDYELLCDVGEQGAVRQPFRIRPREVTEVRLRLP
jgi:hypothetical protein